MGSNDHYGDRMLKSRPEAKSCLVNLAALFPQAKPPRPSEGLELEGWAPGAVHRWLRGTDGRWIAEVTYLITQHDGSTFRAERQLVRAEALRPQ
jgi:hypothetical protein